MSDNVVFSKSKKFAVRIVHLYQYLSAEQREYVMAKQLLKSGTSIGANIAESTCAISEKDFIAKIYIAFKECAETAYWLELLFDTNYINEKEYQSIMSDCQELRKLLSAISKTARERQQMGNGD